MENQDHYDFIEYMEEYEDWLDYLEEAEVDFYSDIDYPEVAA